jgi:hypothetical protein
MTTTKPVHTINARGNIMLEVVRDYFKVPPERMFREIQVLRHAVEEALARKGIKYDELKTALVPDRKRREVALVFDTLLIDNSWYGLEVFQRLIPLFSRESNHSVLAGDYIDIGVGQELLFEAIQSVLTMTRNVDYKHSSQFYIIYINNLTDGMVRTFHEGLCGWEGYVGYADTTYSSLFKTMLSTMLVNAFIKHHKTIIQGHEDDRPNAEDVNMSNYPFEEHGYICRSVQSQLEGTLLSYKIERPVFPGFETDTEFSLNAVSPNPQPLDGFTIEVEEAKLEYVKSAKAGSLAAAGLQQTSARALSALIRSKISASYIYNMAFDAQHDVAKFNVIIELPRHEADGHIRLLASMEYKPEEKQLRLITLY